jgi:hypothetical protein
MIILSLEYQILLEANPAIRFIPAIKMAGDTTRGGLKRIVFRTYIT